MIPVKIFSLIILFPHFIVKKRQQIKNSGEKSKQFSPLLKWKNEGMDKGVKVSNGLKWVMGNAQDIG